MEENQINVIAIDDDNDVLSTLRTALEPMKNVKLRTCDDSEAAYTLIKKKKFDIICLDWKMPGLTGLALLNRIRQLPRYRFTPMIIITGFLQQKDMRLVDEYPLVTAIEKPFAIKELRSGISQMHEEHKWFKKNYKRFKTELENSVDDRLFLKNLEKMLKNVGRADLVRVAAARYMLECGKNELAETLLLSVMQKNPDNLSAHTELGRLYISEKRIDEAMHVLERAQEKSPENLERILYLGDVNLENNDLQAAEAHYEYAESMDPKNENVEARLRVVNNLQQFQKVDLEQSLTHNFAAVLNGIGIGLVRRGKYEKGIEHYKSCLKVLIAKSQKARIAFNLGLGYLRWKQYEKSLEWFEFSRKLAKESGEELEKTEKYIDKLRNIQQQAEKILSSEDHAEQGYEIADLSYEDDFEGEFDSEFSEFNFSDEAA